MPVVSDEDRVFTFRVRRSAPGSAEWLPGPPLLVHVDDSGAVVPVRLSWSTADGGQYAVGFAPDMATCRGHYRTASGDIAEIRGELDDRRAYDAAEAADGGARAYVFATHAEDARAGDGEAQGGEAQGGEAQGGEAQGGDGDRPARRLRLWIDDGGGSPLRSAAWTDASGNSCSVVLCSATPSGTADVTGLVTEVSASAEHPRAGEVAANLVAASTAKWFAPRRRATLDFRLASPTAVARYVLTSANDAADRDPSAWTLHGSADGQTWHALDSRSGVSFLDRHQSRTFRIAAPGAYDHYRLDITRTSGSPDLQLEAVRFLAEDGSRLVGHRQSSGQAPVAFRGTRVAWPPRHWEAPPSAVAPGGVQAPGAAPSAPAMDVAGYDGMEALVVRTDFTDEEAWSRVLAGLREPWGEDPPLEPWIVADPAYDGAPVEKVVRDVRAALVGPELPEVVFIADGATMREARNPLLAVRTEDPDELLEEDGEDGDYDDGEEPVTWFRLEPRAAVEVSVNLGLGNMGFEEFAGEGVCERMS